MKSIRFLLLLRQMEYVLICIRCCHVRMLLFEQIFELITLFL